MSSIPEAFHKEIADCEAQWEEWKKLLAIHELPKDLLSGDIETPEGRLAFLKAHPTLPLDTRHFPPDFTDRLLASFENLDERTDGLLIHSENWQALNLLQEKYRERVKCIHIDPPYNTQASGFLYKNDYPHSSWLAMMSDRLLYGIALLQQDSTLACHIDEYEMERLHLLLEKASIESAGTLVWDKGTPTTGIKG
ncbi:MAG: DNA methyltransferase [Gemmatales bacterium]|nr:DNA methyltransferase [Gemmatales bacterium]MDW7967710.1 DNA methyltransferase [Thermoanaerobaculum sp.]MDW8174650.1 DNA methyltransferase [Gemmatales bacterium]